jgi:hypothetical protein
MKKFKSYLLLTAVTLSFSFNHAHAADDVIDYNEIQVAKSFLYLKDGMPLPPPEPATGEDVEAYRRKVNERHVQYSDYPFSLPRDTSQRNTLFFSENAPINPALIPLIQKNISQLIFKNFPRDVLADLRQLNLPQTGIEIPDGCKGYALHFFGKDVPGNLGNLVELLSAWGEGEPLAYCQHLDFAVNGMHDEPKITGDKTKKDVFIEALQQVLALPACAKLETLSLRFMHINNKNLAALLPTLQEHCPSLKRLVLPFNDLDDTVLGAADAPTSVLTRLIGDTDQLPLLSFIDLRGNNFAKPSGWNFGIEALIRNNGLNPQGLILKFALNPLTKETIDSAFITLTDLSGISDIGSFPLVNANEISFIKKAFNAEDKLSQHTLKPNWLSKGEYDDFANFLVLLHHGAHTHWHTLDFSDIQFPNNDYPEVILRHASQAENAQKIVLRSAFNSRTHTPEEQHQYTSQILSSFSKLKLLSLAGNSLGQSSSIYADIIKNNKRLLRSVDFSSNQIGSQRVMAATLGTTRFFQNLKLGLATGTPIKHLNLSRNVLSDIDFGNLVSLLNTGKQLAFYDLSHNQLQLSGENSSIFVRSLIDALTQAATRTQPLLLLDLSQNPVNEQTMKTIVKAYRTEIEKPSDAPAKLWPVLKIDAQSTDGRTQMRYVSSPNGLRALAKIYDYARRDLPEFTPIEITSDLEPIAIAAGADKKEKARLEAENEVRAKQRKRLQKENAEKAAQREQWIAGQKHYKDLTSIFDTDTAEMASKLYDQARVEEIQQKIKRINESLGWTPVVFDELVDGNPKDEEFKSKASSVLSKHGVQLTPENVSKRAKLLKYVDANKDTPEFQSREERQRLFKTLTEPEQMQIIFQVQKMSVFADGGLPEAEFQNADLTEVLAYLI